MRKRWSEALGNIELDWSVAIRRITWLVGIVITAGAIAIGLSVWPKALPVLGVVALALFGVKGSNYLHDRGFPRSLSRRFAPTVGGFAFLVSVILLDVWTAITVSAIMTVFISLLRLVFSSGLRGVRGTHSAQAWAEITYPLAGTLGLVVGWGMLGDKWLGFAPVAFMAWGDTASGVVRDSTSTNRSPSLVSMSAMLLVCVVVAAIFFRPLWIGFVGGVAATLAERYRPGILGFWDDNLYIVAFSLGIMAVLLRIF